MKEKKLSKKLGIGIFLALAIVMAGVIVLHNNPLANPQEELLKKVISCAIIAVACIAFVVWYDKILILPTELWQSRRLIWKLAKNDFKKRYAGSYLGAVWAMVQPVVTVLMYFFVFDLVFNSQGPLLADGTRVPYVLSLTAGLVPWFFFSEALNYGTAALLEYNYLVKKIVFKISILPIIKVIAASFVHIFFVFVLLVMAACYGYYPTIYTIQLLYYSICLFVFVLAICYTTCAIAVFFKDITQIISICLQVGMWATPILWNLSDMQTKFGDAVLLFKINPLVYIVDGYRSAIFEKQWFFEDFFSTMYFWIITTVLFGIGALVFKRLKVHFADVL